jgi:hypothetical protein
MIKKALWVTTFCNVLEKRITHVNLIFLKHDQTAKLIQLKNFKSKNVILKWNVSWKQFFVASNFSIFFLHFYFPFLFGLLFPFSVWTFISLFLFGHFLYIPFFPFLLFFILSRSHFGFLPNFVSNHKTPKPKWLH